MRNEKSIKNAGVNKLSDLCPLYENTKKLPTYEETLLELDGEIEDLKMKREELINELTHTQEHLMSSLDWRAKLRGD